MRACRSSARKTFFGAAPHEGGTHADLARRAATVHARSARSSATSFPRTRSFLPCVPRGWSGCGPTRPRPVHVDPALELRLRGGDARRRRAGHDAVGQGDGGVLQLLRFSDGVHQVPMAWASCAGSLRRVNASAFARATPMRAGSRARAVFGSTPWPSSGSTKNALLEATIASQHSVSSNPPP